MAHLRAAQRWDALRTQVMKAVRRQRVVNQEKLTTKTNHKLDNQKWLHLIGLIVASIITAVCIIVPLVLQAQFKSQMTEAHKLRDLTHQGTMIRYYDEALTMSARMAALTAGQEMLLPENIKGNQNACQSNTNEYCILVTPCQGQYSICRVVSMQICRE